MYSVSRYSFPNYLARSEIIRMSGFPHSEICGSKVAHTSPQLIAACHVLHRLYAPRHPRIALTSRLRAHTTNNNAGPGSRGSRPLGIALSRYIGTGDYSQPNRLVNCRASSLDTGRLAASRASLKADTFTASILRTHSQCQTRSRQASVPSLHATDLVLFISRYVVRGGAYRDRTDDLMLAKQPLSQLS